MRRVLIWLFASLWVLLPSFSSLHSFYPSALPDEFGKWSSVYRQFRRWTKAMPSRAPYK